MPQPNLVAKKGHAVELAGYSNHIITLPVNNVMAERQFNLASIHLGSSDSKLAKQANPLVCGKRLVQQTSQVAHSRKKSKNSRCEKIFFVG